MALAHLLHIKPRSQNDVEELYNGRSGWPQQSQADDGGYKEGK
jgi:hypothetical protein